VVRWDLVLGVIAVLLGIPSVIDLLVRGETALAIGGFLAALIFLAGATYLKRQLNLPAISVDFQKLVLRFERSRAEATITKQYEFRVHRPDLSQWVHRNISADGQITDFKWGGIEIPAVDRVAHCNDLEVTTRNPYPWPNNRKLHGTLTYVLTNSFPSHVEFLQYTSDMPTKLAIVRVEFCHGDRCTSAYVRRRADGVTETLDIVDRDPNGTWIQVEISKPKGGHEYTLFWHW
jgi:hypothetical protein